MKAAREKTGLHASNAKQITLNHIGFVSDSFKHCFNKQQFYKSLPSDEVCCHVAGHVSS